jgi:hypothetical protein
MALTAKKVYAILKRQISDMKAKLNHPVIYRGTVTTAELLPPNPDIGDMYNIEQKSIYGEAGMNVAWNGVVWDTMGAPIDMSLYLKSADVPEWSKQPNKPTYTAKEIGALPADTKLPSKTSDLQNDSGFLTEVPDTYLTKETAKKEYQPAGSYLSGTDKTLSVSGKAADAAAVGEKLTSMGVAIESVKKNAENQARSITNIQSAIKELNKKMSIDTYDELAEALVSGEIEDYVNVGDELMVNRIKTLSITSSNGNLSFEVSDEQKFIRKVGRIDDDTYVFEYRGNSWMYLEEAINTSDFGFTVKGTPSETDLIYVKMNYEQVSYTFVDFDPSGENTTHPKDPDVKHFAIVEQTYVPDAFNYDCPESALCITPGYTLPKGKYYIYNTANATSDWWCNYKRLYYVFEILNDIVATEETGDIQLQLYARGDRETTGDARGVYELTCKPYCFATKALYNSDTVKFVGQVAQPGEEYTDIRTIENFTVNQSMDSVGIIYNNLGHVCYGNNEWNVSNLRQRMNSSEKSMNPVRTHKNDALNGMYNVKGFMWGLDPRFTNLIKPCIVSLEHGMNDEFTRYQLYTCEDVATLLSMKEMSFNIQTDEGQITKLYGIYTNNQLTNNAIASRAKARQASGTPQDYRWSRSANANGSSGARLVAPSGANGSSSANGGYRFAPAYIIGVADHRESTKSAEA